NSLTTLQAQVDAWNKKLSQWEPIIAKSNNALKQQLSHLQQAYNALAKQYHDLQKQLPPTSSNK
ncbi:hypothetical protein, partial [Lacticaseibacillus paracasei]|uniref:hypothetical protein n=1 Tax=Lacticaseibacillus paracasei TaxID=1597 RepID=UPI0019510C75